MFASLPRMTRGSFIVVLCCALFACASSEPSSGPGTGDGPPTVRPEAGVWPDYGLTEAGQPPPRIDGGVVPGTDATMPASPCSSQGGGERAIIVAAVNLNDVSQGTAALLTINGNGYLADTQVRMGPIDMPKDIARRPDSKEAAISFGTSSSDGSKKHGVALISFSPDGSQASLAETKILDGNFGPLHVSYTSDDSLIVSRIGPGDDNLLPLTRQPGGALQAGTPFAVPNEFPQAVVPIPRVDHESLYLQATITGGSTSTVYRISDAGGTISALGSPVAFEDMPMRIYMHPVLNVAYVPGSVPNPGGDQNPPGNLRVLTPGPSGDWAIEQPVFDLPEAASLAAIAPGGEFMIFTDHVQGTPQWELYMVKLDGAGQPTAATAPFTYDASMAYDVDVTPEGNIIVSRQSKMSGPYEVISFARTGAESWKQCPEVVTFDGSAQLVVAR